MGLRLVLAGLVVGLGLELPSGQELERWLHSGHTWLCVRLDEWNAWTALDEEPIVLSAETAHPALPEPAPAPAPSRPMLSEEELAGLVADMVAAYGDEGLSTDAARACEPAITAQPAAKAEPAPASVASAPSVQTDAAENAVAVSPEAVAVAPALEPAREPAAAVELPSDDEFADVMERWVECFGTELPGAAPQVAVASTPAPAEAAPAAIAPLAPEAALELGVLTEEPATGSVVVVAQNEEEDEAAVEADIEEALAAARATAPEATVVAAPAPAPAPAEPTPALLAAAAAEATPAPAPDNPTLPAAAPVPTFTPIEVPDDLYQGVAFELNRLGEGLGEAVAEPVVAVAPTAEPVVAVAPAAEPVVAVAAATEPVSAPAAPAGHAAIDLAGSRGQRLATAVRLTSEACEAWLKLIQGPAVVSIRP